MWTTSKTHSQHTRSNGTFNNISIGISQLDAQAHSTFFKDFVPSISSHGGILMFPERNFGRINEDGRLHRVSSGTIKGRGFFTMMVIITTLQGTRKPIPPNRKRRKIMRPKYALGKAYDMICLLPGGWPYRFRQTCYFFRIEVFWRVGFPWESDTVDQCHISCPFMPCMLLDHLCVLKAKDSSSSWRRWFYLWVIHSQFRTRLIWGHFGEG